MVLKQVLRKIFKIFKSINDWVEIEDKQIQKKEIEENETPEQAKTIHSIWDYLKFNENTQAHHLNAVLNFNEWIDMDEIRRRVVELFGVEYKNEKSLYPYIKTLADIGLIETTSAGGRRKWRKKSVLIVIAEEKEHEKNEILTAAKNNKKKEN